MKYAWPIEAIFHTIIRQNLMYSYDNRERPCLNLKLLLTIWRTEYIWYFKKNDLKIKILKYDNASYCKKCKNISSSKSCPHTENQKLNISGTVLRWMLNEWQNIPKEFMRWEVNEFIKKYPNPFV